MTSTGVVRQEQSSAPFVPSPSRPGSRSPALHGARRHQRARMPVGRLVSDDRRRVSPAPAVAARGAQSSCHHRTGRTGCRPSTAPAAASTMAHVWCAPRYRRPEVPADSACRHVCGDAAAGLRGTGASGRCGAPQRWPARFRPTLEGAVRRDSAHVLPWSATRPAARCHAGEASGIVLQGGR